jgi:hypothetical protein
MLPSMTNMERVRNPATTCRGSTIAPPASEKEEQTDGHRQRHEEIAGFVYCRAMGLWTGVE